MDKNHILIELSESVFRGKSFTEQSFPQRVFSAVWTVQGDVCNDGFEGYFGWSPETVSFIVEALGIIGAPLTADICKRAIEYAFPSGLPVALDAIRIANANFSDEVCWKLNALDDEFYSCPHDLTELLFAYVSKHPEDFGQLPRPDDA